MASVFDSQCMLDRSQVREGSANHSEHPDLCRADVDQISCLKSRFRPVEVGSSSHPEGVHSCPISDR